jgi:hypothetical protein
MLSTTLALIEALFELIFLFSARRSRRAENKKKSSAESGKQLLKILIYKKSLF